MPYANSLNPDETLSNLASHSDLSYLTLGQHFTNFEQHWKYLEIEAEKKFSR